MSTFQEYESAEAALKQFQREHWRYRRGSYKRKTNAGITTGRGRREPQKTVALNEDEEWREGDEAAEMKVGTTDERLQELGEENRRLDATIFRHVNRVVKGGPSGGYAPSVKDLMKQDIHNIDKRGRKTCDMNLFLENMLKDLDEENLMLDRTIVRQAQNAVREMKPELLNAEKMIHDQMDQIEVDSYSKRCNDGSEKEMSSHNEQTRFGAVTMKGCDNTKTLFDVDHNHMRKMETVETEQSEPNAAVKIVDIFTSHVGEKIDARECEGDEDASNNVKVLSVGRTPKNQICDSFHDYLVKKSRGTKPSQSRGVSLSEARAALNCLHSFLRHKVLVQEMSEIKDKFDNLVQEELLNRLEDENSVLDVAVAHAVKRSKYGDASGIRQ